MTQATFAPDPDAGHIPVMLTEVVEALHPANGKVYVDATFGAGGYSRALLSAANCKVIGIDRDPRAVALGRKLEAEAKGRFMIVESAFGSMLDALQAVGVSAVDGVCFDLGVSSPQIDDPSRGFSFRFEGPLDMRMGQHGQTAADVVNSLEEYDLARMLWDLGEEKMAKRVSRAIIAARAIEPLTTTGRLASVIRSVVPRSRDGIDPATRTFQALRIYVNDELGELERGLAAAERVLAPGGRLAIVSFHSLEDRITKDFLRRRSGQEAGPSRHMPMATRAPRAPTFLVEERRPIDAGEAEVSANPRARSARLRVAERTDAPVS